MPAWRYVDIFIEPNPNCPEGCSQRFTSSEPPRLVRRVLYAGRRGGAILCEVTGWSSEGGGTHCPARAVSVEDSGAGVATLIYGGDWGLRLTPCDGSDPFGEPYLLLADDSLITFEESQGPA